MKGVSNGRMELLSNAFRHQHAISLYRSSIHSLLDQDNDIFCSFVTCFCNMLSYKTR